MEFRQKGLEKEIQDLNKTEVQIKLSLDTIRYDSNNEMDRLLNLRKQAAEQETLNFQSMDKKYAKITKANGDQTYDLLSHNAIRLLAYYLLILSIRTLKNGCYTLNYTNQNSLPYNSCNNNYQDRLNVDI